MKINSNWLKLVRDRWKSVLESLPGLRFNEFVIDVSKHSSVNYITCLYSHFQELRICPLFFFFFLKLVFIFCIHSIGYNVG